MFYDIFIDLCRLKDVKPSRAAEDCGINRSNVSNWKNNGYTPRGDALQRIADYFSVTTDYLLTGEEAEKEKMPASMSEGELDKALDGVDFALYGEAHSLSKEEKEDVLKFVRFLKAKRGE